MLEMGLEMESLESRLTVVLSRGNCAAHPSSMSGDSIVTPGGRGAWAHSGWRRGGEEGCSTSCSVQDSPHQKVYPAPMSIVPRLRSTDVKSKMVSGVEEAGHQCRVKAQTQSDIRGLCGVGGGARWQEAVFLR